MKHKPVNIPDNWDLSRIEDNHRLSELVSHGLMKADRDFEFSPPYVNSFSFPLSTETEFTMEAEINAPLFQQLTNADLTKLSTPNSFTMEYSHPYQEQIRKHKKKRINKKWAKRYGYRTKYEKIRLTQVSFVEHGDEFKAIGNNIEFIR